MNRILFCFAVLSAVGLSAGCAARKPAPSPGSHSALNAKPQTNLQPVAAENAPGVRVPTALDPALLQPGNGLFVLGPSDTIEIEIIGTAGSRAVTSVGLDGKIYYHLLPGLDVWGLTLEQTRELLEKELAKYMVSPQVAVSLRSVGSKYVWLLGRLNRPGIYPLPGSMTLLEALALAGGTARSSSQTTPQELADLRHSFLVRQGQFLPVDFHRLLRQGDMSQNVVLQPDDFVFVRSALNNEIYVLGAVKMPRAVAYQEQMTLISAVAGAEGPVQVDWLAANDSGPFTKDARLTHVAIVRGSLAEPRIIVADCKAIMKGRAPDIRLEPGDIIYVPNSPLTTLKRYLNLVVNSFVTTVAASEGVRAAGGKIGGVGISVQAGGNSAPPPGGTR